MELQEVRELPELSRDSVLSISKRRHIEVGDVLVVLEHGIPLMFVSQLPVLVNSVITIELK